MNVFKRKSIHAAVLASLGAMGVAGSAEAVQLSQDGTGSALIYPYYTVRTANNGAYNTYVNVENTTASAKVVKVRFLEGKNSREVLDFNLWLSPNDVWAGMIAPTATGATLTSADESCVSTSGGVARTIAAGTSFDFSNAAFAIGTADPLNLTGVDGADTSLDRTREGYIEIIEMGVVSDAALSNAVTHNSAGRPNNCALVPIVDSGTAGTAGGKIVRGTGGLMGGATLINVNNGSDFGYDPVVLEDFARAPLFAAPGSIQPTLQSAYPESNVLYYHFAAGAAAWTTDSVIADWTGANAGVNAVSSVIDRISVMNTYVLDVATSSKTDWVVTFPTKRHYVVPVAALPLATTINSGPFAQWSEFGVTGSCGLYSIQTWDREEQTTGSAAPTQVSPPVPGAAPNTMCWETTVISFHQGATALATNKTLLGSTNGLQVTANGEHGWARLTFPVTGGAGDGGYTALASNSLGATTYRGLPVIGFMAQDFINPNVLINGVPSASSYGGNFNHKYERNLSGTLVTP